MPNRIIHESIRMSKTINDLSCFEAEVMFYRLIVTVDDYGIFYADPDALRSALFPRKPKVTREQVIRWLREIADANLIRIYEADGDSYLQITTWARHQQIRAKRPKFPLPPPVEDPPVSPRCPDSIGNQMISDAIELPADDIESLANAFNLQADVTVIQSNPIQSNAESNPIPAAPRADPVPYQKIADLWNTAVTSLPAIKELSDTRRKMIRERWKACGSLEDFELVFRRVAKSDYLTGRNGKWTGCGFDWVLKPANWLKIIEGTYDNKGGGMAKPAGRSGYMGSPIGNFTQRERSEEFFEGLYETVTDPRTGGTSA